MIDRDRTKKLLNIDVDSLKSGSAVKVWWRCDSCGDHKLKPYRDCLRSTGLCHRCNAVKRGTDMGNTFGKTQPLKGKCLYLIRPESLVL